MLLKHKRGNKGIKPIWSLRNCQELPVSGISLLGQVCPACRGRPNCFCIWIRWINIPSRVQRLLASNLHHSKQLILRFTCPYWLAQWQGFKVNRENNEQRTPSWHRRWARGQDQPGACPVAAVAYILAMCWGAPPRSNSDQQEPFTFRSPKKEPSHAAVTGRGSIPNYLYVGSLFQIHVYIERQETVIKTWSIFKKSLYLSNTGWGG